MGHAFTFLLRATNLSEDNWDIPAKNIANRISKVFHVPREIAAHGDPSAIYILFLSSKIKAGKDIKIFYPSNI